ncbi:LysR family transcriptional regulator ArgP [Bosea sp. Root381]|uniref:LysR family transcriptional regulator ArgP n=1 Tax=Bosea sp. Root381 TaxID=1736524 RepID=UPI0009E75DA9|nr:LysR family transcriptional regulator ArgP [Bosea sp. Root381]
MLDYMALAAVAAVAREGAFDRAAATLGVTPSAVSQRVKSLEERMGVALIARGNPCRPTAIGARLCAHVEQVALLEGDMIGDLPGIGGTVSAPTTIRVAVNSDSAATWFPTAAALFYSETGCLLDLVLDDEANTAERLRSGDVVAAVTADPSPVVGCKSHLLGAMEYIAVASPSFMRNHFLDGVTSDRLRHAPIIRFDRRDELQARWAQEAWAIKLVSPTHWTPSTAGMLEMTAAGLGWSMAPASTVADHIADRRLSELPPNQRLWIPLYWQRSRLVSNVLDRLTRSVRGAAEIEFASVR